jgi:hypothetical protein
LITYLFVETDLKSNGIFPRRFEPYSERCFLSFSVCLYE